MPTLSTRKPAAYIRCDKTDLELFRCAANVAGENFQCWALEVLRTAARKELEIKPGESPQSARIRMLGLSEMEF